MVPYFKTKFSWKPPNGYPILEIFLRIVEKDLFDICKKQQGHSKFNSEKWKAMRSLANDLKLIVKIADKGSCVVVWD